MDRYGIKLGVPSFCLSGLHAKPDPAAAPGPVGTLFALGYPFETVSDAAQSDLALFARIRQLFGRPT
jgi:hypothetical protein